jgi:hypothetical protein
MFLRVEIRQDLYYQLGLFSNFYTFNEAKMKKYLIILLLVISGQQVCSQVEFKSEEYRISLKYPEGWELRKGNDEGSFTFFYEISTTGKPRLAVGFSIVTEEAKFDGNMDKMSFAYHRKLGKRREMKNTEILSEKVIDFNGIKAINISGKAKIPLVKQNSNWRILLFEYAGLYYEIGLTASKKDFKNKKIKTEYTAMFDSLKLLK